MLTFGSAHRTVGARVANPQAADERQLNRLSLFRLPDIAPASSVYLRRHRSLSYHERD
jgi:hypothetical protein